MTLLDQTLDEIAEAEAEERIRDAAPDMLAALKGFNLTPDMIVAAQGDDIILRVPIEVIRQAAAAVAKAEGGEPS